MPKKFRRQESQKRKRVKNKWRRPKGVQSKQRKEIKGKPPLPKIGRKQPEETRGLHPSGYNEVLVHNTDDLEDLGENDAARIGGKVGDRKREMIQEKADEMDIKVLNPKKIGDKE
ncbi:50S ribosomal protein L32e [Methanonatronarchaeum sp. AMET6-2]|uniref:50S ribosomal protein L32e n=1 Tax=Methanonatronarchaeum sp. AMET6-2 TaxID=2933293 RepID=UPI00122A7F72|nr:50S ribosomal protein L32e [Methanonatronarchaeum sp. AMET6-2]RZN60224.1 MAG: 50S ribosomal protein L32e [Methanonatronarchaeia archaeon]UOY10718.1 50S ribosomal protein L32e [Methanonatronarchaeum sp. AMET6-2]